MKKINCDIIQDLIPSYADEVCSCATKECVQEHIEECNQCKRQLEIYKNIEISDPNIEKKQIDGLKKFRNQMKRMNIFGLTLILLLVGLGVYNFCTNYISLSTVIYYVLFPIAMIGLYLFTGDMGNMKSAEKKDYIIAVLSLIDIILGIALMFYSINCVISGRRVFSMENAQLGPFINKAWGILFLLLIIGFVYLLIRLIKKNVDNKSIICLQMMGMFLFLAYVTLLNRLDSVEYFNRLFTQITVRIGVMGLAGSLIFAVVRRRNRQQSIKPGQDQK